MGEYVYGRAMAYGWPLYRSEKDTRMCWLHVQYYAMYNTSISTSIAYVFGFCFWPMRRGGEHLPSSIGIRSNIAIYYLCLLGLWFVHRRACLSVSVRSKRM
jgi:hypothetical protein